MNPATINNVNITPNKIGDSWKDDSSDAERITKFNINNYKF